MIKADPVEQTDKKLDWSELRKGSVDTEVVSFKTFYGTRKKRNVMLLIFTEHYPLHALLHILFIILATTP